MKPAYESVARAFSAESKCVVAQMNADDAANKPIASKYDVRSFPTILFFPAGEDQTPIPYQSGRSEAQFIEFLNEHCGTSRSAGGILSEMAGRYPSLDMFASRFFNVEESERANVYKTFQAYVASLKHASEQKTKDASAYYSKVMDRVLTKGEAWIVKEQAR